MISRQVFTRDSVQLSKALKSIPRSLPILLLCASLLSPTATFGQQGTFVPTGNMGTARAFHTATLLKDGRVLIAGGANNANLYLASAELYDPATGTFTLTGSLNTAREDHTATLLNNGMVLIAGGSGAAGILASAELYDPATGAFTPTSSLGTSRAGHTATLLNNGTVLIAAGQSIDYSFSRPPLTSSELYNPTTGTFTPSGTLNAGRTAHAATILKNGTVLIAGGVNINITLASAELYDPTTGIFTLTGSMNTPRSSIEPILLSNGTVLVAGGFNANATDHASATLSSAELYDPATGTFTLTGSLNTARSSHTATLLNNGTVLVVGGFGTASDLASAELYNPSAGAFTPDANLNTARADHTTTLLSDGTVLVAAGTIQSTSTVFLASAERYYPVAVSPSALSFSDQALGTTSAPQIITLTNKETTALLITSIASTGTNATDFAETDNCVGSLSGGASCSINVSFTPAALGSRTGSLNIANNISGNPLTVPLTGTGVMITRVVSLAASNLTFPNQIVGSPSPAQGITLTNTGNSTLTISGLAFSGTNASEFAETDNCVGSVAAGVSCSINITFTPTATGIRNGTLNITDNATSPQSPQTVALSGTGQDFSIAAATPTATVTAGQTATYSLSVSPAGGFSQIVSLNCAGAPSLSTCTVFPNLVTLNGTTATSVTVTVSTTAPALILREFPRIGPPRMVNLFRPVLLLSLLLTLMLMTSLIGRRRERERSLAPLLSLVLMVLAGITLAACGGGGSTTSRAGTQPGTYSLTVSGTFNYGSTTLAHSTKLTLVVQ